MLPNQGRDDDISRLTVISIPYRIFQSKIQNTAKWKSSMKFKTLVSRKKIAHKSANSKNVPYSWSFRLHKI
jgi:hypothetical protein